MSWKKLIVMRMILLSLYYALFFQRLLRSYLGVKIRGQVSLLTIKFDISFIYLSNSLSLILFFLIVNVSLIVSKAS